MKFEDITLEDIGVLVGCFEYAFDEDSSTFEDRDFDVLDAILSEVCKHQHTTGDKWKAVIAGCRRIFASLYHCGE